MRDGKYMVLATLVVGVLSSSTWASAQEIKVQETAGVSQGQGQATLSLTTTDGQQVPVRRVLEQMNLQVTSNFGYNASGFGDVSSAICITPCKLSLPTGYYKLRFGDANPMNANGPLDFNLGPGDHKFRVKPFSMGRFTAGFLLAIVGGSAAIVGTSLALVMKEGKTGYAVMAGAGAALTVGGFVLVGGASASAERY